MDISKITDWLKLSAQQLSWLLLFSSVVLGLLSFAPDNALAALGLLDFHTEYQMWIGLSWIMSLSGLFVVVAKSTSQFAMREIARRRNLRRRQERLRNLTPSERDILRKYIKENTRTQYLGIYDGVVQGLASETILYLSSRVGDEMGLGIFAYNLQTWAWEYLTSHPELVEETESSS